MTSQADIDDLTARITKAQSVGATILSNMTAAKKLAAALVPDPIAPPVVVDPGVIPVWGAPVWRDEFDGTTVDSSKWSVEDGTHEAQNLDAYFAAKNAIVADGQLTLRLQKDTQKVMDGQTLGYSSAYLHGKFSQRFGRWEIRLKALPPGQSSGAWPSFWLRDDKGLGENDIYEAVGTPNAHPSVYPNDGSAFSSTMYQTTGAKTAGQFSTGMYKLAAPIYDFHTYACEWTPDAMTNYVDGVKTLSVPFTGYLATGFPSTANMRLDLFGGDSWASRINANTLLPQDMLVDYVRVWAYPTS